jgi:hypothetical protein
MSDVAIIVSYYSKRGSENLAKLLFELQHLKHQITIVINHDDWQFGPASKVINGWKYIFRRNHGMNIGAWHEGFSQSPNHAMYVFLQDECFVKRPGLIEACQKRFITNAKLGMLGESINRKWDRSWSEMEKSSLNWKDLDHQINGEKIPRVRYYRNKLGQLGINEGKSAAHLRSLCWIFRGDVLRKLNGFEIGRNKGECIAIEIGTSRKVIQLGHEFDQIHSSPFFFVGHHEWKETGSSKI